MGIGFCASLESIDHAHEFFFSVSSVLAARYVRYHNDSASMTSLPGVFLFSCAMTYPLPNVLYVAYRAMNF